MQITGGKVSYSRTMQPAPYESKKGEVELAFTLDEKDDLDEVLDEVGAICKEKANELVGVKR